MQPTSSSFERAALPLTDISTLFGLFAMDVDYLVGYMSHIRETRRRDFLFKLFACDRNSTGVLA